MPSKKKNHYVDLILIQNSTENCFNKARVNRNWRAATEQKKKKYPRKEAAHFSLFVSILNNSCTQLYLVLLSAPVFNLAFFPCQFKKPDW